jgi:outer membrane protein OmpA-like peptidoglycan-associated protein
MKSIITAAIVSSSLIVTGCASTNAEKGAAIGAVLGAIAGKGTGDHDKSRYVWGAALGAITGGAVGGYMDKQEEEFRNQLADSGVQVVRQGNDIFLQMPGDITFATNSSRISSDFYPVLDDVANILRKYDKTLLQIEGHTDSTGSNQLNQNLSESRANSVRNYLSQQQVYSQRIRTYGYGESSPIANNQTVQGRAKNRRVELRIIPNEQSNRNRT